MNAPPLAAPAPPGPAPRSAARYFAWLYADARQRAVLQPLLALEQAIVAALRPGMDHGVAHARLQWWREECDRVAAGAARHPFTRQLLAQRPAGTGAADLSGLVNTAAWDLAAATFETRHELSGYCGQWARALTGLAAEWAPPPDMAPGAARRFGERLGATLRELELLAGLAADARAGRLRLPLSELASIQVDPGALARPPWPQALLGLLSARHAALRDELRACTAGLAAADQGQLRGLLVWARCAHRQSLRAGAVAHDPRQPAPRYGLHRFADALDAWNGARRATAGRFRLS